MEHLIIEFQHGIRDFIPYCEFIARVRAELEISGLGRYVGDDMAIDGGDAEAIFTCNSAKLLFDYLRNELEGLQFMKGAKVTLVFGALEASAASEEFHI